MTYQLLLNSRGGAGKPKSQSWTWFYSVGLKTRHIDRKVGNVLPGRGESEKGREKRGRQHSIRCVKLSKNKFYTCYFKNTCPGGWRDYSVIRSIYFSGRGPRFSF